MACAVTILSPRRMVMRYGLVATNPIERVAVAFWHLLLLVLVVAYRDQLRTEVT